MDEKANEEHKLVLSPTYPMASPLKKVRDHQGFAGDRRAEQFRILLLRDTSRSVVQNGLILIHYTTGGKLT
jgi:hypothetical protein